MPRRGAEVGVKQKINVMRIRDLHVGMSNVTVEAEVVEMGEEKIVTGRDGKQYRVAVATISDGTGKISLTLWNGDIDKVKQGSKILLRNGYVYSFRRIPHLTRGKRGKLIVLEGSP